MIDNSLPDYLLSKSSFNARPKIQKGMNRLKINC